jgi:hypothetical protein
MKHQNVGCPPCRCEQVQPYARPELDREKSQNSAPDDPSWGHESPALSFKACHPDHGLKAEYCRVHGVLTLICRWCLEPVCSFDIAWG